MFRIFYFPINPDELDDPPTLFDEFTRFARSHAFTVITSHIVNTDSGFVLVLFVAVIPTPVPSPITIPNIRH